MQAAALTALLRTEALVVQYTRTAMRKSRGEIKVILKLIRSSAKLY